MPSLVFSAKIGQESYVKTCFVLYIWRYSVITILFLANFSTITQLYNVMETLSYVASQLEIFDVYSILDNLIGTPPTYSAYYVVKYRVLEKWWNRKIWLPLLLRPIVLY